MLPDDVAAKIMGYSALIPDEDIYEDGSGEHGRETEPHITVKYGLHTNNGDEVAEVLAGKGSAEATLGEMTAFENEDYTVLKLDVDSPDLHKLNKKVGDDLEVTDSYPEYHPHVTIAYLRKEADWKKYACGIFEDMEVVFHELLFSSADDVETDIELGVQLGKVARMVAIKERVAMTAWDRYVGGKDRAGEFSSKTQFVAKVTLACDGSEHDAQSLWVQRMKMDAGIHDVRIVEGRVGSNGMREN
jgi:2'-5' RNA ligase